MMKDEAINHLVLEFAMQWVFFFFFSFFSL